ncbi:MAG: SAM-dependent methyltransferase [Legionella sp.]|nr:MAG: SAM-dependent methyltransferase [Legionella sp.]
MALNDLILTKIKSHPPLSFADFMQLALYAPEGGYYTVGLQHFGQDFTTAPEISSLFSYALAHQCRDVLSQLIHPVILEFGAGSGRMCIDLLTRLEQLNCLPDTYYILELSGRLQSQQHHAFAEAIPHLLSRITWIQSWPTASFEGIILANEILDAMPVHRFLRTEDQLYEICVDEKEGHLQEVLKICDNEPLKTHIANTLPENLYPYQSEVNLFLEDWIKQCSALLQKGLMLIVDYGFPRHEYFHPDRHQGTLMCHHHHRAHTDPLIHVGEQDITAHVEFTHVAEAAVAAGFSVAGFTSQASFLLANGLLSLLEACPSEQLFKQQQAVKTLLQPNEMGELFKVMALTKAWDEPLCGFQMQDRRASL